MVDIIPKVTIALPVYQGEEYLEQAIDSLLNQTYQDFQIIISNDASTDRTNQICEYYRSKSEKITYTVNEVNFGAQGNLLKILSKVESEYFVWASQDDYWDKNFLMRLVNKLEENQRLSLAFSTIGLINKDMSMKELNFSGKWDPNSLTQYELINALLLPVNKLNWLKTNLAVHGVVRTSAIKQAFDNLIGIAEHDRIYILFMIYRGCWSYVDEVLYFRRTFTGIHLRAAVKDVISDKQKLYSMPLRSSLKMLYGTMRISDVSISMRLYSIIIILLYCVCTYWTRILSLLSSLMKNYCGEKVFIAIQTRYRRFKELF